MTNTIKSEDDGAILSKHSAGSQSETSSPDTLCVVCKKRKKYDSNGLCVACNYSKMMGFGLIIL